MDEAQTPAEQEVEEENEPRKLATYDNFSHDVLGVLAFSIGYFELLQELDELDMSVKNKISEIFEKISSLQKLLDGLRKRIKKDKPDIYFKILLIIIHRFLENDYENISNDINLLITSVEEQGLQKLIAPSYLNQIRFNLKSLADIREAYDEIRKLETGEINLERIDLIQIARNFVNNIQDTDKDRIMFDTILETANIKGLPSIIEIILRNLINNAIKYGRKSDQESAKITVKIELVKDGYRLSVEDQGEGMTAEEIHALLNRENHKIRLTRHKNSKIEGTGLGLRLVMAAVDRLGGKFGINSEKNQGSTFWIEIPNIEASS